MTQQITPGQLNLITDVAGLKIGNAEDHKIRTGITVLIPDDLAAAAVDIRGGAPGSRETNALEPENIAAGLHGLVLSGGSVFGLAAADRVAVWLAAQGRGFLFGKQPHPCPVVPAAILFDLMNGGDKDWGDSPPYQQLAGAALENLKLDFNIGRAGAGFGAIAGQLRGGLGSASCCWQGFTVGALVAVNSVGSVVNPHNGEMWAAPYRFGDEFPRQLIDGSGESGPPPPFAGSKIAGLLPPDGHSNTTIAVVATDADLSQAELKRVAIMAGDGMARAIRPLHTSFDGDSVFALATAKQKITGERPIITSMLGAMAGDCLARAIARGVSEAQKDAP